MQQVSGRVVAARRVARLDVTSASTDCAPRAVPSITVTACARGQLARATTPVTRAVPPGPCSVPSPTPGRRPRGRTASRAVRRSRSGPRRAPAPRRASRRRAPGSACSTAVRVVAAEAASPAASSAGACRVAGRPRRVCRRAALERALGPRLLALRLHGLSKPSASSRSLRVLAMSSMKSRGMPKVSYSLKAASPGTHAAGRGGLVEHVFEPGQPVGQDGVETLLFAAHHAHDRVAVGDEFRVGAAELGRPSCPRASTGTARRGPACLPWRIARRMILRST